MEDPNPVENIDRLGDLMFQTSDKSQLLRRVLWINAQLTIVWSLKHKISQPIYIFNRENSQNSESPNGPRRGLDFIALPYSYWIKRYAKNSRISRNIWPHSYWIKRYAQCRPLGPCSYNVKSVYKDVESPDARRRLARLRLARLRLNDGAKLWVSFKLCFKTNNFYRTYWRNIL
jgi:hypothetical protein